jgi:hypothetical protein
MFLGEMQFYCTTEGWKLGCDVRRDNVEIEERSLPASGQAFVAALLWMTAAERAWCNSF